MATNAKQQSQQQKSTGTSQHQDADAVKDGGATADRGGRDMGMPGPAPDAVGKVPAHGAPPRPEHEWNEHDEAHNRGGKLDPVESVDEELDETIDQSFPASDPPSHTPTTSLGSPHHAEEPAK